MTRRANGEASIVTLKDGSWRAAFRFDREDGTTGRKYLRATTQTDARRKLREAQRQVSQGVVADGQVVAQRVATGSTVTMLYFVLDHLGSVAVITDSTGLPANAIRQFF